MNSATWHTLSHHSETIVGERSVQYLLCSRDKWKQRLKHSDLTDLPFTDQGESTVFNYTAACPPFDTPLSGWCLHLPSNIFIHGCKHKYISCCESIWLSYLPSKSYLLSFHQVLFNWRYIGVKATTMSAALTSTWFAKSVSILSFRFFHLHMAKDYCNTTGLHTPPNLIQGGNGAHLY